MNSFASIQNLTSLKSIFSARGRGKIYDSIADTIGDTPLVRLNRLPMASGCVGDIFAKVEFFNPLGSVRDRLALGMIRIAEAEGKIDDTTVLVEPSSGNTGISLALICAARGYPLIVVMPDNAENDRKKMLKHLGAQIVLTDSEKGMTGAIAKAEEIVVNTPNAFMLQQYRNPSNPMVHSCTTAEEIWHDTNGHIDVFVAGVGSGGTLQGVGEVLKRRKSGIKIVAVGNEDRFPRPEQKDNPGYMPDILDPNLLDEILVVSNEEAILTARAMARLEGIPGGISSGGAMAAAIKIAQRPEMKDKAIVTLVSSSAERYLSSGLFQD